MGFSLGHFFFKLKPHRVKAFKIKYLKNYLKIFQFLILLLRIKHPPVNSKLWSIVWMVISAQRRKMSIPDVSVPMFLVTLLIVNDQMSARQSVSTIDYSVRIPTEQLRNKSKSTYRIRKSTLGAFYQINWITFQKIMF